MEVSGPAVVTCVSEFEGATASPRVLHTSGCDDAQSAVCSPKRVLSATHLPSIVNPAEFEYEYEYDEIWPNRPRVPRIVPVRHEPRPGAMNRTGCPAEKGESLGAQSNSPPS